MMHGFRQRLLLLTLATYFLPGARAQAAGIDRHPIVIGFERFYTGEQADSVKGGQLLLGELNCVSCHQPAEASLACKQAPILDEVASRVRIGYLRKYLLDPQAYKPGTSMPNLFANDPDKVAKVDALVHFLASTGGIKQVRPNAKSLALGKDFFHKIGCVACHGPRNGAGLAEKTESLVVPLGDLQAKYSITSLSAFLENPYHARPSGRMPQLVTAKEALDIANYLLQGIKVDYTEIKGATRYAYYEGNWPKLPDFAKLKPKATGTGSAFDLSVARRGNDYAIKFEGVFRIENEGQYKFWLTSDDGSKLYIDGHEVVNNDGVHPPQTTTGSMQLTKGIHRVTVGFFQVGGGAELDVQIQGRGLGKQSLSELVAISEEALSKQAAKPKAADDDDWIEFKLDLADKGRQLFVSVGCANCHALNVDRKPLVSTLQPIPLVKLKGEGGCISATPVKGLPYYALNARQQIALAAAIQKPVSISKEPAEVVARTLTTFNCYACHARNQVGGIDPEDPLNKFFQTTQPEMGDEGRIPPPLTGVGAKLKLDYLKKILDKGSHDRPYMHTRMPAFGLANVGPLIEAFTALDKLASVPPVQFTDSTAKVKAVGRHMVGGAVLSCFKCHTFAGTKAEGVQGIDMTIMKDRLQRDWFHAYLIDPSKVRPGTRMPAAWPNGQSFYKDLLDGKASTQIEAIWLYLNDGKDAQPPLGLGGKQSIPLVPTTTAILYRNFIQGAGTRAIGVGYPEKANLAFDANDMRLALIWQGAFIDAGRHWNGRGEGYQGPLGDNILKLPAGATFVVLSKPDEAWPTTAPKELGYKFSGYQLTPDDRPKFYYTFGDLKVEDFPNAVAGKEPSLRRTLGLSVTKPVENIYFRAAVGNKIEALSGGWYHIDGFRMRLTGTAAPVIRQSNGKMELLVPVRFTERNAQIVQEIVW